MSNAPDDGMKRYTLRTLPWILDKFGYIAESEGRSKNKELEMMMKKRIREYEREHGAIPIEGEES